MFSLRERTCKHATVLSFVLKGSTVMGAASAVSICKMEHLCVDLGIRSFVNICSKHVCPQDNE